MSSKLGKGLSSRLRKFIVAAIELRQQSLKAHSCPVTSRRMHVMIWQLVFRRRHRKVSLSRLHPIVALID